MQVQNFLETGQAYRSLPLPKEMTSASWAEHGGHQSMLCEMQDLVLRKINTRDQCISVEGYRVTSISELIGNFCAIDTQCRSNEVGLHHLRFKKSCSCLRFSNRKPVHIV